MPPLSLSTFALIRYQEDDEDEWMDLPSKDVAIIDEWEGKAQQLESWEGFTEPTKGKPGMLCVAMCIKRVSVTSVTSRARAETSYT